MSKTHQQLTNEKKRVRVFVEGVMFVICAILMILLLSSTAKASDLSVFGERWCKAQTSCSGDTFDASTIVDDKYMCICRDIQIILPLKQMKEMREAEIVEKARLASIPGYSIFGVSFPMFIWICGVVGCFFLLFAEYVYGRIQYF